MCTETSVAPLKADSPSVGGGTSMPNNDTHTHTHTRTRTHTRTQSCASIEIITPQVCEHYWKEKHTYM